jgi:hypothetical protein
VTAAGTALLPACTLRACLSRLPGNRARPVLRGRGRGNASPLPAEIYFSVVQRKLLTPDDFPNLDILANRLTAFEARYNSAARHSTGASTATTSTDS